MKITKGFKKLLRLKNLTVIVLVMLVVFGIYFFCNYNVEIKIGNNGAPRNLAALSQKTIGAISGNPQVGQEIFTDQTSVSDAIDQDKIGALTFDINYQNSLYGKRFRQTDNLFLNDSSVQEILQLDQTLLTHGSCVYYGYNPQEKVFRSLDTMHPRYGGSMGSYLNQDQSQQILESIVRLRDDYTAKVGIIMYCSVRDNSNILPEKILIYIPSKESANKDIFVGLLDENSNLTCRIDLKVPTDGDGRNVDPIAYTTDGTFYIKLSGKNYNGDVNLFRINFNKNSYTTLYQGK